MPESPALVEQREQFHSKQAELAKILEEAKDGQAFDLGRAKVMELLGAKDAAEAATKLKERNRELDDLGQRLQQATIKGIADAHAQRAEQINEAWQGGNRHPEAGSTERKSWAQLFIESKEFQASRKSRTDVPFSAEIGLKTLFETGAGFAPESVRSGVLVPAATRPIQILDLIPVFPIGQPIFKYMEETTRTHASAEKAEGAAYAESTFVWTEKTSPVQKITDSIPVTDEQLEDEAQVRSLLEQRLTFGLRQRLDLQVLVGNGTAPNLRGINNVVGIQTQAKGADPAIVAFMKALTKVRFTGRASPSGAIFHPNDWQDILLTQNSNGDFLFGNPFTGPGPQSLFGIPVAVSDAQTQDTGLVVDFANFTRIDDRRGVQVQTGFVGTQFTDGKVTLRADMRAAFTVTRPAAVCAITGI
ncbi:MAG: phage major capsid protein [Vicinamibacterales bacterium]